MAAKILDMAFPEKVIDMWRKGSGCDITIICEGNINLKAHSLVLCSVSDKLDDLLTSKQNKILHTPHVKPEVWRVLLETVYTGIFMLDANSEAISDVLYVAKCFEMKDLIQALEGVKEDLLTQTEEGDTGSERISDTENSKTVSITTITPDKYKNEREAMLDEANHTHSETICEKGNTTGTSIQSSSRKRPVKRGRPVKVKREKMGPWANESRKAENLNDEVTGSSSDSDYCRSVETESGRIKQENSIKKTPSRSEVKDISFHGRHSRRRGVTCKTCNQILESYKALMKHTCEVKSVAKARDPHHGTLDGLVFVDIIKTKGDTNMANASSSEDNDIENELVTDSVRISAQNKKSTKQLSGKQWLKQKGLLGDFEKGFKKSDRRQPTKTNKDSKSVSGDDSEKQKKSNEDQDNSVKEKSNDEDMLTPLNIKQEAVDIDVVRKCLCYKCGQNCTAERVRCALCYIVVRKDLQHMEECHPFTPKSSAWVFRCNYIKEEDDNEFEEKHIQLSAKLPIKSGTKKYHRGGDGGNTYHKCLKCKKCFQYLPNIKKHFVIKHQVVLKTCTVCEAGFQFSYYLRDHQHFCQGGELYKCNFCGETLGGFNAWTSHVEKHAENCNRDRSAGNNHNTTEPSVEKSTEASVLPVEIYQNAEYQATEEMNETQVDPALACKCFCLTCRDKCTSKKVLCLYCFQMVDRSSEHMLSQHPFSPLTNTWVYSCNKDVINEYLPKGPSLCSKVQFHRAKSDVPDIKVENGDDPVIKVFACQTCDHVFSTFEDLVNHISHKFFCHACDGMFDTLACLADHFKLKHSNVAFHACQICNMGFADTSLMDCHNYYCGGGSILLCQACDLVFTIPAQFEAHMAEVVHQNESLHGESMGTADYEVYLNDDADSMTGEFLGTPGITENPVDSTENPVDSSTQNESKNKPIEVSQIVSDVPHKKVCLICGLGCRGDTVQCGYCAERIPVVCKKSHFDEFHPCIPPGSLWPVYCNKARLRRGTNKGMLVKQIVASDSTEPNMSLLLASQNQATSYKCCRCDFDCELSETVVDHIKREHDVDAVNCTSCGMVLYAHQDMLVSEHRYFCQGGTLYQCSFCHRVSGSEKTAALHRRGIHKTYYKAEPWSNKKGQVPINLGDGENGYKILCVGCRGKCDQGQEVMCGLCREMVNKDDSHMKIKHASSPSKTWVVCCNFKMMAALDRNSPKIYIGQKVPDLLAPYRYKCLECTICFEEESSLKEHIADEHAGRVFIVSDPCNKLFSLSCQFCGLLLMCTRNDFLVDHVQFCSTGSLHMCNMCGLEFASYEKLRQHQTDMDCGLNQIKRKKAEEDGSKFVAIPPGFKLKCAESGCAFSTTILRQLKDHNKFKHGYTKYEVNQICQVCFKVFRKRSQRERHEELEHLERDLLCDICGDSFHTRTQYTCHKRYHHEGKRAEICEKQKLKRALAGAKECGQCGKQFKSPYLLNQHVRIYHEKSLAITCHICGKSFLAKHRLLTHLNRHGGIKPYQCTACPYKDYTGALVNKHMRKLHPGVEIAYKKTTVTHKDESEEYIMEDNGDQSIIEETMYQGDMGTIVTQGMLGIQQNIIVDDQQVDISGHSAIGMATNDPNIIVDENSADPHVIIDENMYKYIIFK